MEVEKSEWQSIILKQSARYTVRNGKMAVLTKWRSVRKESSLLF